MIARSDGDELFHAHRYLCGRAARKFLRDGLESIDSDELVLKLISPLRPGLIESPDTGDFVYLIMPIRLNV